MKPGIKIYIFDNDQKNITEYKSNLSEKYILLFFKKTEELLLSLSKDNASLKIVLSHCGSFSKDTTDRIGETISKSRAIYWIVLGDNESEKEILNHFEAGASEYFSRPIHWNELKVKVERALKPNLTENPIGLSEAQLAQLTLKELRIFKCLEKATGYRLSRDEIVQMIWGNLQVSPKSFDVHLFHLRKKLWKMGLQIVFISPNHYRIIRAHK